MNLNLIEFIHSNKLKRLSLKKKQKSWQIIFSKDLQQQLEQSLLSFYWESLLVSLFGVKISHLKIL